MASSGLNLAALLRRIPPLLLLLAVLVLHAPARGDDTAELAARSCTYTVKVKTSCASPRRTADAVSLAFGDAYRNEAHAPRLPTTNGALGRCATDTFRVAGPCGYGVCYLYLRRSGPDGWAPDWVQVVQPGPGEPVTATFYFGDPLPDGVWYGHNRCPKATKANAAVAGSSADKSAVADALPADVPANKSSASPRG